MWSDGVLFAFNQVEGLDVTGQQIDFNCVTKTAGTYERKLIKH